MISTTVPITRGGGDGRAEHLGAVWATLIAVRGVGVAALASGLLLLLLLLLLLVVVVVVVVVGGGGGGLGGRRRVVANNIGK